MSRRRTVRLTAAALVAASVAASVPAGSAGAADVPPRVPLAVGTGGAVATVDPDATRIGLQVLRDGGNAADAAVAAAAALGVTEPYSAGVGGGGFLVHYDAQTREVSTIDGRETAPMRMGATAFLDGGTRIPLAEAVTSGLSVGTPGTPMTWAVALEEFGTMGLREVLRPSIRLAREGFVVDETFRRQTADNEERFRTFPATAELFLPGGRLPEVGSVFRNPDLAATYRRLARGGVDAFYRGRLAREVAATARDPQEAPGEEPVRGGLLTAADLAAYEAPLRAPTVVSYRGLDVYGMAPPSSGGSTVGEALEILERFPLASMEDDAQVLHHYLEAAALAFADRNAHVGDPAYTQVPLAELLDPAFAAERACAVDPARALGKPVLPGLPDGVYGPCPPDSGAGGEEGAEGLSTTHLTVADAEGDVVSYTLTIEQTGGSGITVPGRGFLLNNELTDFDAAPASLTAPAPNLPAPGKRPRSSMSPTIVLHDGEPVLALGSPGGSTIITTVLQVLVDRLDRNLDLGRAIAAPRASQRNTAAVTAEPAFLERYGEPLRALGHTLAPPAPPTLPEIGAATGVELLPGGLFLAAAEPTRRGGGSAGVVRDVRATPSARLAPDLVPATGDAGPGTGAGP